MSRNSIDSHAFNDEESNTLLNMFGLMPLKTLIQEPETVAIALLYNEELATQRRGTFLDNNSAKEELFVRIVDFFTNHKQEILQNKNEHNALVYNNSRLYEEDQIRDLLDYRLPEGSQTIIAKQDELADRISNLLNSEKPIYAVVNESGHFTALAIIPVKNEPNKLRVIYQNSASDVGLESRENLQKATQSALEGKTLEVINIGAVIQDTRPQCVNSCGAFATKALEIIETNQDIISNPGFRSGDLQSILSNNIIIDSERNNTEDNSYRQKDAHTLILATQKDTLMQSFDNAISHDHTSATYLNIGGGQYRLDMFITSESEMVISLKQGDNFIDLNTQENKALKQELMKVMPLPEDCIKCLSANEKIAKSQDEMQSIFQDYTNIDKKQTWTPYVVKPSRPGRTR
ncbi:MAG: hypothetical protein SFT68_00260 [Rickettsiaceae bacterium]|nr:hypothetical protein [Rickettsiaceae bacterium]